MVNAKNVHRADYRHRSILQMKETAITMIKAARVLKELCLQYQKRGRRNISPAKDAPADNERVDGNVESRFFDLLFASAEYF